MKKENYYYFILCLFLCFICNESYSQHKTPPGQVFSPPGDSVPAREQCSYVLRNELFRHSFAPAFFMTSAFLTWGQRENIMEVRNRYIPEFSNHLDDYLQYAPAMGVFGLTVAGKKGRNSWQRQLANWGGGMLIMGTFVNSIKYTTKVMRPDGTTRNSFPSGHTATAFMNAGFLHKEYGHISPWYTIAGYTSSSYVGVSRSLNNRHWISDILAGAAIGLISTELSYAIIDHLYKNKGDYFTGFKVEEEIDKPSYLSARLGYCFDPGGKQIVSLGIESGFEGAYYFNKRWGIVAEAIFGNYPFPNQPWKGGDIELPEVIIRSPQQELESAGFVYLMVGPQYAKPIGSLFLLQAKVIAGTMMGLNGDMVLSGIAENKQTGQTNPITLPLLEYKPRTTLTVGAGVSLTALMTPRFGVTLFADYKYTEPVFDNIPSAKTFGDQQNHHAKKSSTTLNNLSTGLRLTVFL